MYIYTEDARFEWDEEKRRENLRKHSVEFADAVSALEDEEALTSRDEDSDEEERFVTLGADLFGRILVVVYTWRGDIVRLISARKATRRERKQYGER
jgi:uncharacterized DUF497 family protein